MDQPPESESKPYPRPWPCAQCGHVIGHVERRNRVDWLIYHGPTIIETMGTARLACQCCGFINEWYIGEDALKRLLQNRRKLFQILVMMLMLFVVSCSPGPSAAVTIPPTSTAAAPTPTVQPTIISTTVHGVSIEAAARDLQTYLYNTELSGKRVYKPAEIITKGTLIKLSMCVNHYAQVEFRDGDWWRVRWIVCE